MNKLRVSLFAGLTFILLFLSYHFFDVPVAVEKEMLRGRPLGGDFTLQSKNGPFTMSSLKGNVILIYFGFTSCPDVCPTTLSNVTAAFKKLPAQQMEKAKILFITVDPERDTMEKLSGYADFFHPAVIPLRGANEQLNEVAGKYGAYFRKVPIKSALGYTMDHSTNLFVVDPQGAFVDVIHHDSGPEEIAGVIRKYLQ